MQPGCRFSFYHVPIWKVSLVHLSNIEMLGEKNGGRWLSDERKKKIDYFINKLTQYKKKREKHE